MHLENANGCSVCAWLLTSGGLRLTLRLTPQRQPLASLAGADQAHTLSQTNQPLNRPIPSHKRERATLPRRTTKSAAGSGAVPADPLGIGCRFSPPLTLSFCAFDSLPFHACLSYGFTLSLFQTDHKPTQNLIILCLLPMDRHRRHP